ADVSLDQMLVALLQANPDAFIRGNVNRVKAGAVLQVPSASAAAAIPATEARRTVVAQHRDFNTYLQRRAATAPAARTHAADRQAAGRLQANVEDRKAAAASPDKLTISQGSAKGAAAEEKLAQTRQAQETTNRVAELSRNIEELNKLQGASGSAPAAPAAAPSAAPAGGTAQAPAAAPAPAPAAAA